MCYSVLNPFLFAQIRDGNCDLTAGQVRRFTTQIELFGTCHTHATQMSHWQFDTRAMHSNLVLTIVRKRDCAEECATSVTCCLLRNSCRWPASPQTDRKSPAAAVSPAAGHVASCGVISPAAGHVRVDRHSSRKAMHASANNQRRLFVSTSPTGANVQKCFVVSDRKKRIHWHSVIAVLSTRRTWRLWGPRTLWRPHSDVLKQRSN